jgi:hypothetical protein
MSELDSNPRATWTSLVQELQPDPADEGAQIIPTEADFHIAFEDLCLHMQYREPQRLLARFLREHSQIIAFVGALDESLELHTGCSPGSCFWTIAYATIQVRAQQVRRILNVHN